MKIKKQQISLDAELVDQKVKDLLQEHQIHSIKTRTYLKPKKRIVILFEYWV